MTPWSVSLAAGTANTLSNRPLASGPVVRPQQTTTHEHRTRANLEPQVVTSAPNRAGRLTWEQRTSTTNAHPQLNHMVTTLQLAKASPCSLLVEQLLQNVVITGSRTDSVPAVSFAHNAASPPDPALLRISEGGTIHAEFEVKCTVVFSGPRLDSAGLCRRLSCAVTSLLCCFLCREAGRYTCHAQSTDALPATSILIPARLVLDVAGLS